MKNLVWFRRDLWIGDNSALYHAAKQADEGVIGEPLDLQSTDLAELVSRCEIDHSVGPSHDRYFSDASAVTPCGDWASGSRVEGAFLSGMAAAGRILGTLLPIVNTAE